MKSTRENILCGAPLRDRLCELEPQNALLRERYTKELQAMLEMKLSVPMKGILILVSVVSVAIAICRVE